MGPVRQERRWWAMAAAGALVVAVLWPAVRGHDSFPFSNYPMFSQPKERVAQVNFAVGVGPAGEYVTLDPMAVSGTDQVIQAARTVTREIGAGRAEELCIEIGGRLDGRADIAWVEVVSEDHDVVAWFDGQKTPLDRTVHARCPALRS